MHDLLAMHFLESLQYGKDGSLDLHRPELVLRLDLIIKLTPFKQLHNYIQRILGLEYLVKFHAIFVVEIPHNFYLLYEAFLALVFRICGFFGKSLHCITLPIF